MQLKLSPCTVDDAEAVTKVTFGAFAADHINRAFYRTPEDRQAAIEWYIPKTKEAEGFDPSERPFKVVDEDTGEVVGHSVWTVPHKFTKEEDEKKKHHPLYTTPPMANKELFERFFGELLGKRALATNAEKDFVLTLLVVLPDYQGKGVGSLLLKHGLSLADEANARAYLEASPSGYPIYKKYGWIETGEVIEIKLKDYGYNEIGDRLEKCVCMMRPKKSERVKGV